MDIGQENRSPNTTADLNSNDTLHITGIAPLTNKISELNAFFSKYGKIVLLKEKYSGDPYGALVSFASHDDAKLAFNGLKNNPLLQVSWHQQKQISWPCESCGKLLASKQSLKAHMTRMHAGDRCSTCNIRFESRKDYEKHYNVHHVNMSSSIDPGNQSVQSSSMLIDDSLAKFKKLRVKYGSIKKKLKKNHKFKLKLLKKAAKTQKSLSQIIKEQEELLTEKDATLELMRHKNADVSMKLVDEQKKVELKETALIAMQRSNNLIQEENQKLLQTLMNERSTVAMLKETMSKIFNGR